MQIHFLKTQEPWFTDVMNEDKRFELRKNDRGFQVLDWILLFAADGSGKYYFTRITYLLEAPEFLQPGIVAIGLGYDRGYSFKPTNLNFQSISIPVEDVDCPYCGTLHSDVDEWALRPHKTHLCGSCGKEFEGTMKGVSRPTFYRNTSQQ